MKQEELVRLETKKIESIRDLILTLRKLDYDMTEIGNAILTALESSLQPANFCKLANVSRSLPLIDDELVYPDFSIWEHSAITTETGIVFAPEDFCVYYGDGLQRDYFSYDEAMEIEENILRPYGWRLPTAKEWLRVINEFVTPERLRNALKLSRNGYIPHEGMDEYRRLLDYYCALVRSRGIYG